MAEAADRKITQNEFDTMAAPLELDLQAYFNVLRDAVMEMTFDSEMTPEAMITEITGLLGDPMKDTASMQVQKEDRPVSYRFFQGMFIGIENPKGSVRTGVDPGGHRWKVNMNYDYGYLYGTGATDGDSLDVYIGPDIESKKVYAVKQVNPDTQEFDEVKVMLGFPSSRAAILAYRSQYDNPNFYGGHVEYSMDEFKSMIFNK